MSKDIPKLCSGAAAYNTWSLSATSHTVQKKWTWAIQLKDAGMLAKATYLPDVPPNPADLVAHAAAQAAVEQKRRKTQTNLHYFMRKKCAETYFTKCSSVSAMLPNCCTLLW